ncbi:MAG: hypothetical protein ACI4QA_05850, partial [Candidatus Spyradosoma sp.]
MQKLSIFSSFYKILKKLSAPSARGNAFARRAFPRLPLRFRREIRVRSREIRGSAPAFLRAPHPFPPPRFRASLRAFFAQIITLLTEWEIRYASGFQNHVDFQG